MGNPRSKSNSHPRVRLLQEVRRKNSSAATDGGTGRREDRRLTQEKVAQADTVARSSQVIVLVPTAWTGLLSIDKEPSILTTSGCLTTNGVIVRQPNCPFHVLVANFSNISLKVQKSENFAATAHHRTAMAKSAITVCHVVKNAPICYDKARGGKYLMNRQCTHKGTITKQASSNVEAITHETVNLDHVDGAHQGEIRAILAMHSSIWGDSVGDISTVKHLIDLNEDDETHSCPPYRAVPSSASSSK